MKRLLFIVPAFNHGGTNKSLVNLLSCLSKHEYIIDIFALAHIGPYKEILAPYRVLDRSLLLASIFESYEDIRSDPWCERTKKILTKSIYRGLRAVAGKKVLYWAYRRAAKKIDQMDYDTVVSMQENVTTHFASYIKNRKVAWIRCDYDNYFSVTNEDEESVYDQFDEIICVSEYTRRVFTKHYPFLAPRSHGIHNMIDQEAIISMSSDMGEFDNSFDEEQPFSIISIGRLSKVKQFDLIPALAAQLRDDGCVFRWYIIGDGEEKAHILKNIEKFNVWDIVVLLGEQNNPYPYIKQADLLVCTSISEACPNVINEAMILHIPVVSTDFGSASEFINNGVNGIIANRDGIINEIRMLIQDKTSYQLIKNNLRAFTYSNDMIICEITKLL